MHHESAKHLFQGDEYDEWARRAQSPPYPEEALMLRKWLPENKGALILEGGTGAGRLAFFIESLGFQNIQAFDLVEKLVHEARTVADAKGSRVEFFTSDLLDVAGSSSAKHASYDAIVYFQQLHCLVPLENWDQGMQQVYRLLRPGGKWLASFCQHEGRWFNPPLRVMLSAIRCARGQRISGYSQPLLRRGGSYNRRYFGRDQFLIHWLPKHAIQEQVTEAGFKIIESTTTANALGRGNPKRGMLYLLCEKPT